MGRLVSFVCNQPGAKKLALVSAGCAYVVDVNRVIFVISFFYIEKRHRSIELGAFS